jgi:hypothetical protein
MRTEQREHIIDNSRTVHGDLQMRTEQREHIKDNSRTQHGDI